MRRSSRPCPTVNVISVGSWGAESTNDNSSGRVPAPHPIGGPCLLPTLAALGIVYSNNDIPNLGSYFSNCIFPGKIYCQLPFTMASVNFGVTLAVNKSWEDHPPSLALLSFLGTTGYLQSARCVSRSPRC